jgi:hypothetical protein
MTFTISPPFEAIDEQDIEMFPSLPELTVAQAAQFLDMSEGCVEGLLDLGILEFRLDDGRRLVQRDRLLEYESDYRRGLEALAEITRESQEMGLYD